MPTEEFRSILDRHFAVESVRPLTQLGGPLLRELVNHACWAARRCEVEAADHGEPNEHLAAFTLYRQVTEMADGAEVLLASSCGTAAIPLVRSEFEAAISLSYLLQSPDLYRQRALSWVCLDAHRQIEARELLSPAEPRGRDYIELYERENSAVMDAPHDRSPDPGMAAEIQSLRDWLAGPQLAPIDAEYQRVRSARRGKPEWFALFGGPANRADLAIAVEKGALYRLLYGDWSAIAHATSPSRYLTEAAGRAAFEALRTPRDVKELWLISSLLLLSSTRRMLDWFRRGEPTLVNWYAREVQPLWQRLADLDIHFVPLVSE